MSSPGAPVPTPASGIARVRSPPAARPRRRRGAVLVAEHLEGLAEAMSPADLEQATLGCRAHEVVLAAGPWTPPIDRERYRGWIGLLIVDGLLTRTVTVGDLRAQELLGPGDIVRPWDDTTDTATVAPVATWKVLDRAGIALLDARFAASAAHWPALTGALLAMSVRRSHAQTVLHTIIRARRADDRLLLLFWHLADRWGRVGRDGITIPLALTHACLADLVCLRRPTVTAALVRLREAGHLQRRADGSWRLAEDSLPLGTAAAAVSSG
jgi:hypothetical protein